MVRMDCPLPAETLVHEGYGRVRRRGILSKWSERWLVLCRDDVTGSTTLEIHASRRSCKANHPAAAIRMDGVVDVSTTAKSSRFTLVNIAFRDGSVKRFGFTYLESKQWLEVLKRTCLHCGNEGGRDMGTIAKVTFDENEDGDDDVFQDDEAGEHSEDREEEAPQQETFNVWIRHSSQLPVSGACTLTVDGDSIRVVEGNEYDTHAPTVTWPLGSLRRYGYDSQCFTIEAGRRCSTGEGIFLFKTTSGEDIQTIVQRNTELLAKGFKSDRSQSVFIDGVGRDRSSASTGASVTSCFSDGFAY